MSKLVARSGVFVDLIVLCYVYAMLPSYPQFASLDISHKNEIHKICSMFEPYSDFDFTSLFGWNTDGSSEVSNLGGNLVIKLPHYITSKTTYSLLGENRIDESLGELIRLAGKLELVPEPVIKAIKHKSAYEVTEEIDQFDYVYSVEDHAFLNGQKFKGKRKKIAKFMNRFESNVSIAEISFQNKTDAKDMKDVFLKWAEEKQKPVEEIRQESIVLDRFINHAESFNLVGLKLSINKKVVGFSIVEISRMDYALYHFHKILPSSGDGSDVYLTNQVSRLLFEKGCRFINWEQDLGIGGLRQNKMSYHPIKMLKKYKVQRTLL